MTPLFAWQYPDWTRLSQYRNQQRIPQAVLLLGRSGLGKQRLARQFAESLLCATPQAESYLPCGTCKSCQLLQAGFHPDLFQLIPESPGKDITIDQMRGLIEVLTLKPQYTQYRVIIIDAADQMNLRAQNAFLKCLEEPADRSVILMITEQSAKLPATIVSRCQQFALTVPARPQVMAWLATQTQQKDLDLPYRLAQGAPLKALAYCSGNTLPLRQDCFNAWLELANHRKSPVQIAELWKILPDMQLLDWLLSWVSDIIKCHYGVSAQQLGNPDFQQSLQVLAQRLHLTSLFNYYELLLDRYAVVDSTVNKQLLFEELLIHWQKLNLNSLPSGHISKKISL